jgi:hypothetical protein
MIQQACIQLGWLRLRHVLLVAAIRPLARSCFWTREVSAQKFVAILSIARYYGPYISSTFWLVFAVATMKF